MKVKKILAVVLSTMMVAGMATTGMAGTNDLPLSIGGGNSANCYVYCGDTDAGADTDVYAANYVSSITASVDVTFIAASTITGYEITVGSDSDSVSDVGTSAYASAYISDDLTNFVGVRANSSHSASVTGYTPVSASISAYN